mmetsp:Transcript_35491/g.42368  ORF Transcript_35491/g.42368 Transcript_35491/m.42368 type:complete len:95 (-) Transcript_35491:41-325(-)
MNLLQFRRQIPKSINRNHRANFVPPYLQLQRTSWSTHPLYRSATEQYETSRDTIANFIHASSRNDIIFTSGATEALKLSWPRTDGPILTKGMKF